MNRKTALVGILILSACVLAQLSLVHAACTPIAHAEAVVKPGAHVHVGEMHGNAETPRAVGELACLALEQKAPVRVALEIPAEEDAAISVFIAAMGGAADREVPAAGRSVANSISRSHNSAQPSIALARGP